MTNKYLATVGTQISKAVLARICVYAGIRFDTVKDTLTKPRLGRHYCNSYMKLLRTLVLLWSTWGVGLGIDAKSLVKVCPPSSRAAAAASGSSSSGGGGGAVRICELTTMRACM
jgi:hypothetical protein